jgi:hypothetical protein
MPISVRASFGSTQQTKADMARVLRDFNRIVKNLEGAVPQVLLYAAQPIFDKSQVYVPLDTGRLMESGYMEVSGSREDAVLEIGYGRGGDPPYAPIVHENMDVHHATPTRSKFLQAAIDEHLDDILPRAGVRLGEAFSV